jgi:hypothetical protein
MEHLNKPLQVGLGHLDDGGIKHVVSGLGARFLCGLLECEAEFAD